MFVLPKWLRDLRGLLTGGFNAGNQLVRLTSDGKLPALNGSLLTGLPASPDLSGLVPKTTSINGHTLHADVVLTKADVQLDQVDNTPDMSKPISTATQAALNNKADIVAGKVPASQLPSYVDDVLEYASFSDYPAIGESSKIYLDTSNNTQHRWAGSSYVSISSGGVSLGETSSTAYRGDRGKAAYDHSVTPHAPSDATHYTDAEAIAAASSLIDVDAALTANSNAKVPSQKAVVSYLAAHSGTNTHAQIDTALSRLANTSGTNTGDQDLSGYALLSSLVNKADLVGGKIPAIQLPSYVDDVLEFTDLASFPPVGETAKIYLDTTTNLTYRWGGSSYVSLNTSLALGESSSTAYRGDRGKIAYDHSQSVHVPVDSPTFSTKATVNANTVLPASAPLQTFHWVIGPDSSPARATLDAYGGSTIFQGRRANGTAAAPTKVLNGHVLSSFSAWGYGATGWIQGGVASWRASQDWSDTVAGSIWSVSVVPTGSVTGVTSCATDPTTGALCNGAGNPYLASVLTSAVNCNGQVLQNYRDQVYDGGGSSSSFAPLLSSGAVQKYTISATLTITLPAPSAGASLTLILTANGAAWTFAGTVFWLNTATKTTAPTFITTAGAVNVVAFFSDGVTWYGSLIGAGA